jgi:hypothetical protein
MMPRKHLVGTIYGSGPEAVVLIEFLGEGAVAVVYETGRIADLSPTGFVLKFVKPQPFLDMETLHYSLSIHDAYPNHPLRMTPQERMRNLSAEMIAKMKRERTVFATSAYRDILGVTLTVLATELPTAGDLDETRLDDVRSVAGFVDDALLHHIQVRLEEEEIVDGYVPFFERLVEIIPRTISRWKAAGRYHPIWENAFVRLLGFNLEDFINTAELRHIATTKEFVAFSAESRLDELFDLGTTLHFRAEGQARNAKEDARLAGKASQALWSFLEFIASLPHWSSKHYVGLARLWRARGLSVESGRTPTVKALIESALEKLTDDCSLGDRHDALIDLLEYQPELPPERTEAIVAEIHRIRARVTGSDPAV